MIDRIGTLPLLYVAVSVLIVNRIPLTRIQEWEAWARMIVETGVGYETLYKRMTGTPHELLMSKDRLSAPSR